MNNSTKKLKLPSKQTVLHYLTDTMYLLIGSFIFALSINMFILPGGIILGGATGIATILHGFFPSITLGTLILLVNIPIMIAGFIFLGWRFMVKTAIGLVVSSVFTDIFTFFPVSNTDPLLCALLGGFTLGAGLGFVYRRGFTTGGTDVIVMIIRKYAKSLSAGSATIITDFLVVGCAFLIKRDLFVVFYAVITIFVESRAMDYILGGADKAKVVYIISEKQEQVAKSISDNLERGITIINCEGYYTQKKRNMIMCVIRPSQMAEMKEIVKKEDKNAFVIFADASSVYGYGFMEGQK